MSKIRYFATRVIYSAVLLWVILTFLFLLFRLMPGDVTSRMVIQGASPETLEALREKWGLNEPLYVQYWSYITNLLTLDLGTSLQYRISVWEFVRIKIFNSFVLVAPAITIGYILGSILGVIIGTTSRPKLEEYGIGVVFMIGTVPIFFLAIIAVIIFGGQLGWVPSTGMVSTSVSNQYADASWWRMYLTPNFLHHYILPFFVVMIRYSYVPTLYMRTSITELYQEGFTFYQRITGLPKWRKAMHLGRHASLPIITVYPLSLTRAIGGLVLVEVVFNWPGIGNALVQAVFARDYPVLQFIFLLVAAFILISNLIVDFVYGIVDPRVSVGDQN